MRKIIKLTRGFAAWIDDADFYFVAQYKWHAVKPRDIWYAARTIWVSGKSVHAYMHREIMKTPPGMFTDHVSHDRQKDNIIDNRRCNLRICTPSQNQFNRRISANNKSGITGVHWCNSSNRWIARIYKPDTVTPSRLFTLGKFVKFDDAVKARKDAELIVYGEFSPNYLGSGA